MNVCPICKAEYRSGFAICSDCHVALVPEKPTSLEEEFIEYEEVLYTFNPADIAFIKSILDAEGITYYFHGEHFNYVRPLALPARLMVKKSQVENTKEILKDANLSIMAINLNDNSRTEEDPDE